jgi:hypothetical protein
MSTQDLGSKIVDISPEDVLLQWEMAVAIRADELARTHPEGKNRDRQVWLQAEQEVLHCPCSV